MRRRRFRRVSRLSIWALLPIAAAAPAAAQADCLAIAVQGAPSATIFVDGFEGGTLAAWTAPVLPSFSIVATDDLVAEVTIDGELAGDHLLELRWTLPGGALYQSVAVPFTAGGEPVAGQRIVADHPFPVAVVAALHAAAGLAGGPWVVASRLPVAGTLIVETELAGTWRVEAFLDGSESACGAPADFRLER